MKALNTVFRWGGEIVDDEQDIPEKEEEVLVSKGEAYIGPPPRHTRRDGKIGEVRVIASQSFIHEDVRPPLCILSHIHLHVFIAGRQAVEASG